MDMIALALLALFAAGGSVLAGGDIGAAIRVGGIAGNTARRTALAAFGPFCLSHEVWLVAAAGLLTGLFASVEENVFARAYPWVVLLLLGWIARNVGLWLRGRVDHAAWRWVCDRALIGGARLFAASWGALLASASGGAWWAIAANAIAVPLLLARHGNAYLRLRLVTKPGRLEPRIILTAVLLALGAAGAGAPIAIGIAVIAGVGLFKADEMARRGRDLPAAAFTAMAVLSTLIPVASGVSWSVSAAPAAALLPIVLVAVIMLPLLLGAQALTWWLFRSRVSVPSYL